MVNKATAGTDYTTSAYWSRWMQSVPASYTIWKDGTTIRAESNISGADDFSGTNAGTVIQSAIDIIDSGIIFVRAGVYEITTTLLVPEAVALIGENRGYQSGMEGTQLKLANAANCVLLKAKTAGSANVLMIGLKNIFFNGNAANQGSSVNLVDLYDSGNARGEWATIENCYFSNAKLNGLTTYLARVNNCYFLNAGGYCGAFMNEDHVTNCDFAGGDLSAVYMYNGVTFVGNNADVSLGNGIDAYGAVGCEIIGNRIFENAYSGILLENGYDNQITGNLILDNNYVGSGSYRGIDIAGTSNHNHIIGNTIRNNTSGVHYLETGIKERGTADYNVIMGNSIYGDVVTPIVKLGANTKVTGNIGFSDIENMEHHTASDTLTSAESGSIHTNLGAGGAVKLTLPQDATKGCWFEFVVMTGGQQLQIDPGAAGAIYINGAKQTDDKYQWADDEGESVKLVADGNGDWIAINTVGTWTSE